MPPFSALPAGQVVLSGFGCQFQFLPAAIALVPENSLPELGPSHGCQLFKAWENDLSILCLRGALPNHQGLVGAGDLSLGDWGMLPRLPVQGSRYMALLLKDPLCSFWRAPSSEV